MIENLDERLERLAFPPPLPPGALRPPLEAYRVTPTEHGHIYRATDEYRAWFLSAYPAAGGDDRVEMPSARPPAEGVGGENAVAPTKRKHSLFA